MANRRIGGSVTNIIKDKYCIDVISVTIGNYVSYLAENNTTRNYTISYKWNAPNGLNTSNGTAGLSTKSIRHIYDNREKPNQIKISVSDISCTEF